MMARLDAACYEAAAAAARSSRQRRKETKDLNLSVFGGAALSARRYETAVIVAILILVGVRLACAAFTPLSFDEALYWDWSKHIAGGYYSPPPINPILIRLGTTLFGDT